MTITLSQVMTFIKDVLDGIGIYNWIVTALVLGVGLGVMRSVLRAVRR